MAAHESDRLARFLARHSVSAKEEVEHDVAPHRGKSPADSWRDVELVSRAAMTLLAANPDRAAILDERDPPHPTYAAIIRGLRRRAAV